MYNIGQIFEGSYPKEAARYCNEHGLRMTELTPLKDGTWRFQIQERQIDTPPPALKIAEYQAYLDNTDWYVVRQVETGVLMPEDVKIKRQAVRKEIDRLRNLIGGYNV